MVGSFLLIDLCWKDIYAPTGRFILYLSCKLGLYLYNGLRLFRAEGDKSRDAGGCEKEARRDSLLPGLGIVACIRNFY